MFVEACSRGHESLQPLFCGLRNVMEPRLYEIWLHLSSSAESVSWIKYYSWCWVLGVKKKKVDTSFCFQLTFAEELLTGLNPSDWIQETLVRELCGSETLTTMKTCL